MRVILFVLSVGFALSFVYPWAAEAPERELSSFYVPTVSQVSLDSFELAFRQHLVRRGLRYSRVRRLSSREKRLLRRSRNDRHLELAARIGHHHEAEPAVLQQQGVLTELARETPYYTIYDNPGVLTPDAAAALDLIGAEFQVKLIEAGLAPAKFTISSTYRSAAYQKRLRRRNRNATRGTSSHEFGTTFDLAYHRYAAAAPGTADPGRYRVPTHLSSVTRRLLDARFAARERAWAGKRQSRHLSRMEALLGRALIALEDEGRLIALREWRQPCFHITVAEKLAEKSPATT